MFTLTAEQQTDKEFIKAINYPNIFFDLVGTSKAIEDVKHEFYSYILNAVKRFLGVHELTEYEKKIWLAVITTEKHGLIYFINKREAQESLSFVAENINEIETLKHKLLLRDRKVRDLINYAFHRFVYNTEKRCVEKSKSELVSYDAVTSISSRKIAIREGGPFDADPDNSFFETNEEAKKTFYYYDDYYDEHYDGHHLAHYVASLLGEYVYFDYDPFGSASCLPKCLRDIFTDSSHPLGSFVIFTWLLRPLLHEVDRGNNDDECIAYMASCLKNYLLGRRSLFSPTSQREMHVENPTTIAQLAVSVQSAIGEMPVALIESELFTRGANSRRKEDMAVDPLNNCSTVEIVRRIAAQKVSLFQRRIILRQKAKLAGYFLTALHLLNDCSRPEEVEILQEIIHRIQNCNGANVNGKNLHHKIYELDFIQKDSLEEIFSLRRS